MIIYRWLICDLCSILFFSMQIKTSYYYYYLKLEDIHKLEVGKLMFKNINNGKALQFRVLFTKSREIHNHSTRLAKNESIYISQIQINSGKNQFNMQEQYCEIKYLIPLNLFLLFLSKKNIKNN